MSLRFCTKATLLLEGYFKLLDERCQVYIWNHLRLNWKLKLIFLSNNNFYLINLVSNKNYFFLLFYKKSVSFNSGSNYYFKCPYQIISVTKIRNQIKLIPDLFMPDQKKRNKIIPDQTMLYHFSVIVLNMWSE